MGASVSNVRMHFCYAVCECMWAFHWAQARWHFYRASARSRLMRSHVCVWSSDFMLAFDRAKGTFACSRSYGIFAFHRANARVRLIALMLDSYFSCESAFASFRANSRSGFIERIHARVLFRECTFAFHRATAHWRFIVWMHVRVISSESTLTFFLNECALVFFLRKQSFALNCTNAS